MNAITRDSTPRNPYALADLSRLAADLVGLHFGSHQILKDHPIAFLECLTKELECWHFEGDIGTVLARMMPGLDKRTYQLIPRLVDQWLDAAD